jgi:hypothetical protein
MARPAGFVLAAVPLVAAALAASTPAAVDPAGKPTPVGNLFRTFDRCFPCHSGISTQSGQDVSMAFDWRPSVMANSSRDPYWQAGVRREVTDHPESQAAIEDECSICHMPMARFLANAAGRQGQVFAHLPFEVHQPGARLAQDGVSCSLCHQITAEKLGTRESFVGGFVVDTKTQAEGRLEFGPYDVDPGHALVMKSSSEGFVPTRSAHVRRAELCAPCHTLITTALGPQGQKVGELPEQVPYLEWLHSGFRDTQTCQGCHMPAVGAPVPITRVFGDPREDVARHTFFGGNFFLKRLLNLYRSDLGVDALPQELDTAAAASMDFLRSNAASVSIGSVELRGDRLEAAVKVQALTGHKFPTAYPSRRAWLHVTIRDRGNVIFESGALEPTGLIRGNDNDADATRYEAHHREVASPDEVQIYESIMVDPAGAVTTGLLRAVRFVKDNRLLPSGFDKGTADPEVAVQGSAADDPDFTDAGDVVRYSVPARGSQGPFQVEAEFWYQVISFRWAHNLEPYQAFEPQRFLRYYQALSPSSGLMLARATASTRPN